MRDAWRRYLPYVQNASTVARVGKRHVLTEVSHEMLVCRKELLLAFRIVYKIFLFVEACDILCRWRSVSSGVNECDFSRQTQHLVMVDRCKWLV